MAHLPDMTPDGDAPAGSAGLHVGRPVARADGPDKVHGRTRFTADLRIPGMLHAALVTSAHAHAEIVAVHTAEAASAPGVRGVFTGADFPMRIGLYLGDRPPLARERIRYFGEPVAAVVADDEASAIDAASLVRVETRPLPPLRSPREALAPGAPVLHPQMAEYLHIPAIRPEPGTNVGNRTRIRKGDADAAFREAEVTVECEVEIPPGDHAAMEPRVAIAEVRPDGRLIIHSATQSPYNVRIIMSRTFGISPGRITVIAPAVGGGFGGKAGIQLEPLAYLLSKSVGGRPVRVLNTREQDLVSSPGRSGLQGRVRLGARRDGTLLAADIELLFDSGGYADYAVNVSRAAGYSCTGPYRVPNVRAESLAVYTNHPFATAYRGFGHIEMAFAVERAMDLLADRLAMDPVELRRVNAIGRGDTTPTQDVLDESTGDLRECLRLAAEAIGWSEGARAQVDEHRVRARGVSCFWKAPAIPTFADAGAIVTFNEDGSVNLVTGAVEIGQGVHTGLAQIVAERLRIDPSMVHAVPEVMTDRSPHDWTTAASRTLFMCGRAALAAVDDAVAQIKRVASAPLRCPEEDLEVAGNRVFLRDNSGRGLALADVVTGYVYPDGNAVGGPIIGRGRYIARHLTGLDPETGEGRPGLEWTLGAEAAEVEVDLRDGSYRVLRSACAMDVGRVVNPALARGQVVGAMAMGIGYATREAFAFSADERVANGTLRDFKILRYGEQPQYIVRFVETPQQDGPFGARGLGEQGIVGIPAALAGAFSRAVERHLTRLPITPEALWRARRQERGSGE